MKRPKPKTRWLSYAEALELARAGKNIEIVYAGKGVPCRLLHGEHGLYLAVKNPSGKSYRVAPKGRRYPLPAKNPDALIRSKILYCAQAGLVHGYQVLGLWSYGLNRSPADAGALLRAMVSEKLLEPLKFDPGGAHPSPMPWLGLQYSREAFRALGDSWENSLAELWTYRATSEGNAFLRANPSAE